MTLWLVCGGTHLSGLHKGVPPGDELQNYSEVFKTPEEAGKSFGTINDAR